MRSTHLLGVAELTSGGHVSGTNAIQRTLYPYVSHKLRDLSRG